ncbi:MAG: hypothetical protein ACE5ES_01005 [Candidatus Nanoarchaeia archaeon]
MEKLSTLNLNDEYAFTEKETIRLTKKDKDLISRAYKNTHGRYMNKSHFVRCMILYGMRLNGYIDEENNLKIKKT